MEKKEYKYHSITERIIGAAMKVEIKSIIQLENVHLAQAKNYLETYNMQVGLLINFGAISLQFKRLENQKFTDKIIPVNL